MKIRFWRSFLFGLSLFALYFSHNDLKAAQDALVAVEEAPVRAEPNHDAAVLEFRKLGSPVRISSHAREGWFKVRTLKGLYGWLWQADVVVPTSRTDAQAANMDFGQRPTTDRKERLAPWLYLRVGAKGLAGLNRSLSNKLGAGANHIYPNVGGYVDVAFTLEENLRLALRVEYLGFTQSISYFTTDYDVSQSSVPILVGLDVDVIRGEAIDFGTGLYVGGSSNSLTVKSTTFVPPNSFTVSNFTYAILINFTGRYWLSQRFALVGEIGGHISPAKATQIASDFNGSQPFLNSEGRPGHVKPSTVGPFFSAGVQVAF